MKQELDKIITEYLGLAGKTNVVLHTVEELAELQKELLKNTNRDKDNVDEIFDETTDVYIMLEYIKKIYNFSDMDIWKHAHDKSVNKILPRIAKIKKEKE